MCMGIAQKKETNKDKAKLSVVRTMRYLFSVIKVSLQASDKKYREELE